MRRQSVYLEGSEHWDSSMTPMIDVVFLLLIFFVWTASFHAIEYDLPSQVLSLEASGQGQQVDVIEQDFGKVEVEIEYFENRPLWTINGQPTDRWNEVERKMQQVAGIKTDVPVVIDPAGPVPLGVVIDVYDLSLAVGFEDIQFVAPAPVGTP